MYTLCLEWVKQQRYSLNLLGLIKFGLLIVNLNCDIIDVCTEVIKDVVN